MNGYNTSKVMVAGNEQTKVIPIAIRIAHRALDEIAATANSLNEMNQQLADGTEKQSSNITKINDNVVTINSVAQKTSKSCREALTANETLASLASDIKSLLNKFKV